jgi:drug/metabolite transporter (DMT)-like permease
VEPEWIVYGLTALGAVVVVATRLQLDDESAPGRHHVGRGILNLHTVLGVLALVGWVVYLVNADDLVGIVALAFWWLTVFVGLMILLRWLPSRGRHATVADGTSSDGPALSVLAHIGMLFGVMGFTWFYVAR